MNEVLINEFSISAPLGNCQNHQLAFNLNNNTNRSTAFIFKNRMLQLFISLSGGKYLRYCQN